MNAWDFWVLGVGFNSSSLDTESKSLSVTHPYPHHTLDSFPEALAGAELILVWQILDLLGKWYCWDFNWGKEFVLCYQVHIPFLFLSHLVLMAVLWTQVSLWKSFTKGEIDQEELDDRNHPARSDQILKPLSLVSLPLLEQAQSYWSSALGTFSSPKNLALFSPLDSQGTCSALKLCQTLFFPFGLEPSIWVWFPNPNIYELCASVSSSVKWEE